MRGLILAIQFLTRLPTPAIRDFAARDLARSALWFPVVGGLIGGVVALATWLGARLDPWLGALLGLGAWVWVTGALHLDGLADLADALGAAHRHGDLQARRARFLAVLADPHAGVFGVVALVMQLAAKLVLLMLAAQVGAFWAIALVPAWARWGTLAWSRLPALKPGMGERFSLRVSGAVVVAWAAALAGLSLWAPALLVAPMLVLSWHAFLRVRLGGMTGDALGAGVEWVESGLLLALAILAGLVPGGL